MKDQVIIRAGREVKVPIDEIVVGDLILLNDGDEIPADGVVIHVYSSLAIDKFRVSGESNIFPDVQRETFLMSGWKVAHGRARMLVLGVGKYSTIGILRARTDSENTKKKSHLEVLLKEVALLMLVAAGIFVVCVVIFDVIWWRPGIASEEAIRIWIIAVNMCVFAFPVVPPLALGIIRYSSMKKMKADNALVRRPAISETFAVCTDLLIDKTVITLNKMTVVRGYAGQNKIEISNKMSNLSPMLSNLLAEGIVAQFTNDSPLVLRRCDVQVCGSPTQRAITDWGVNELGINIDEIRSRSIDMKVSSFGSDGKRGCAALNQKEGRFHIHWSGAAEKVLPSCTGYIGDNDQVLPMDKDKSKYFKEVIDLMAFGGSHSVAIAYRSVELNNEQMQNFKDGKLARWKLPDDKLILLAIFGIKDNCGQENKESVGTLQRAGIKVRLITYDDRQTTKPIAEKCGILSSDESDANDGIVSGEYFRQLSDSQREEVAEKILVLTRASPDDKRLLMQALQRKGKVVGVTGYVNEDTHALHEADIGYGMGIQGTEVVKESSDIIILDDSLATIAKSLRWGRYIHKSVLRVIQQQVTANFVALIVNCFTAATFLQTPLNAVQFVWVNVIMLTLGPLALACGSPADDLLNSLPIINRRKCIIKFIRWKELLIEVVYLIATMILMDFQDGKLSKSYASSHATKVMNTMIFNRLVAYQISSEFDVRKTGIVDHPLKWIKECSVFVGGMIMIAGIQVINIHYLGKVFLIVRLNRKEWQISLTLNIIVLFFALLERMD